jgi:hypothetical protein
MVRARIAADWSKLHGIKNNSETVPFPGGWPLLGIAKVDKKT